MTMFLEQTVYCGLKLSLCGFDNTAPCSNRKCFNHEKTVYHVRYRKQLKGNQLTYKDKTTPL